MKHDIDFSRRICRAIEAGGGALDNIVEDSPDSFWHHHHLLQEAGLVRPDSGALTAAGHDFVALSDSAWRWAQAKAHVEQKLDALPFGMVREVLAGMAREELGL